MVTGWHLRFASCNFIFPEFSCYASAMIRNNFPSARLIFNSWLALCFSSPHYKYCNSTKHRCSSRNWKLTLLQRPVQSMRRCLDLRNISGKPSDHITCSITLQYSQTWGFNRFSFWYMGLSQLCILIQVCVLKTAHQILHRTWKYLESTVFKESILCWISILTRYSKNVCEN